MAVIVGSIYLVSTVAFGLVAGIIGLRLIALSLRTGQQAERWLGAGLLLTAGFGIATVAGYWLTFFPPACYRARLAGGASAG